MSRVPEITSRDEVQADKKHIFDEIVKSRGKVSGPFAVLINSPEVAGRAAHLGSYIRFESILSPPQIELATITASREFDSNYEWAAHVKLGREAGVSENAIDAVANNGPLDSLDQDDALIVQYGRELLREHKVTDATFEAAKSRFEVQGVTDLTVTMGYYGMLALAMNAFEVEPPPGSPRLPDL